MSTKSTVRVGENWHLYTEVFEEEVGPHAYLRIENAKHGEFGITENGSVCLTVRLEGDMLALLDPKIQSELRQRQGDRTSEGSP